MENIKNHQALVLDTLTTTGLSVVRDLGRQGLAVTTMDHSQSPYGISRYVNQALLVPHYRDQEDLLVQYLIDYAQDQDQAPVLFFTDPAYLDFFYRHFNRLKKSFLFPLDDRDKVFPLMDLRALRDLIKDQALALPDALAGTDPDLRERTLDELGYPVILRSYRRGFLRDLLGQDQVLIRSEEDLLAYISLLKGHEEDYLIQAQVPGPDSLTYHVHAYYGPGSSLTSLATSEVIRLSPPRIGQASYIKQKWVPDLLPLLQPLLNKLQWRGYIEARLKRDEFTSRLYLLDLRPTFSPYNELLASLGFHAPYFHYLDALGGQPPSHFINSSTNAHWKDRVEDLSAIPSYLRSQDQGLVKMVSDYKFRKTPAVLAWDDPGPSLAYTSNLIIKGGGLLKDRASKFLNDTKSKITSKKETQANED